MSALHAALLIAASHRATFKLQSTMVHRLGTATGGWEFGLQRAGLDSQVACAAKVLSWTK